MAAYAYAITINRNKEIVQTPFTEYIEDTTITAQTLLDIAGNTPFSITPEDCGGYRVEVYACRLETDDEQATRIAKGEAYMQEYKRRKAAK